MCIYKIDVHAYVCHLIMRASAAWHAAPSTLLCHTHLRVRDLVAASAFRRLSTVVLRMKDTNVFIRKKVDTLAQGYCARTESRTISSYTKRVAVAFSYDSFNAHSER